MTSMENRYSMPLLFGVCRKQGHWVLCRYIPTIAGDKCCNKFEK